jgi:hypothetical protein
MPDQFLDQFDHFPDYVWDALLTAVAIAIGLIVKFLLSLLLKRKPREGKPHFSATRSTLSRLGGPFSYFLPLLTLNFLLPLMKMRTTVTPVVNKLVEILLTISFATVLIGVIKVFEDYVYHTFDIQKPDNLKERKIRTQLQFIRRMAITLILILTVCAILLSFTLTYVVLHIWDQRRLILPINYFIEKPFQNWTRNTADIMGTVFLYLDYATPLEPLRVELTRLLENDPLWDKRVKVLQVTNTSEKTMEVRALMSSSSSGNAFDLRCNVREGLIKFLQDKYPDAFPVVRLEQKPPPQPEAGEVT